MTESSRAAFLSYASQDAEAAKRICDALRAAGIEVWFDQSELRGGDAWDAAIRKQIKSCSLFIPIISRNSHERGEGYFRLEWKLAVDRSHLMAANLPFLVPVVIDATDDTDDRVPDRFREVQWTRVPAGVTSSAFVERVSGLLSPKPSSAPAEVTTQDTSAALHVAAAPRPAAAPPSWRKALPLVIASVAAIGVGYLALDKLVLSKPGAAGAQTAAPTARSSPSTPSAISEKSIAVLPFVDMSEKKDQEYFADGMAEEVLDLLAKIPGLTVIGRTSSFQFKTATEDLRSIGAKLGAAYVVEGSVRKAGDQIRVTAQLIDVRNGAHRWSDSYDRKISDVFKVQDDIAVHLARALDIAVSADFGSRASMPNTDAYDLYLRGLHADDRGTKESDEEAVADFQQALHIAPGFAAAAVALSRAYEFIGDQGWLPTHEAFEHAREAAEQAIQLDPTNGAAHAELAEVHIIYDWNWSAADDELKQATKLGANAEAMLPAARLAASRGKWDEAAHLLKMGLAIDPLNPQLHEDLAFNVYFRSGHFAEAESSLRRLLEISPSYGSGRYFLGISLLLQRRFDEALTILRQETLDDGQLEGSAMVYYAMGRKAESDAALKKGIERNADSWSSEIARVYAFRGERDQAMKWLERAYTARDEDLYFIKGDPLMKNLEGDPRYQAFLRKMSLPE